MIAIYNQPHVTTLDESRAFLVMNDFEAKRRVTANQLRQLGTEKVATARDGKVAMRVLRSQNVIVVLSDWNMTVMSGLQFLKAIRADAKVLALTFIMIAARPVVAAQSGTAAAVTNRPRELQRPTVLVVDKTSDNLILLSGSLKEVYLVRLAQNGTKALEMGTSDNTPDLVLLGSMMSGMDGFEVAPHTREPPNSKAIPVIFVTAMTSADARCEGLDLGAVDFITKPVGPETLKLRVRHCMRYEQICKNLQAV
ncbi:MAG: response regulator [Rhodoferax sp.]